MKSQPAGESCLTCNAFVSADGKIGECRAGPRETCVAYSKGDERLGSYRFPIQLATDWCREYVKAPKNP